MYQMNENKKIKLLTFCWLVFGTAAGTKKFIFDCAGIVGITGANKGVSFLGAAPDGLNTSTYDFLRASNG